MAERPAASAGQGSLGELAEHRAVLVSVALLARREQDLQSMVGRERPGFLLTVDGVKKAQKSYVWVTCTWGRRPIVVYHNGPGRGSAVVKALLEGFTGYLQVDGYKGYDWVSAPGSGIKRVGCLAHVRRKFVDFLKALKKDERRLHVGALQIRALIRNLYAVEDELRANASLDRAVVRQEKSQPIFESLEALVASEINAVASAGLYGKALAYAAEELPLIKHYLAAAEVEIDNNLCENALRPFCLGKKNWLFAQTKDGGEASANIYSLIMTARANGLNAQDYLRRLIEQLPRCSKVEDYVKLLPH